MSNYECWFCDKAFPSSLELWLHTREIHEHKEVKIDCTKNESKL
jgi:hypothetical protein